MHQIIYAITSIWTIIQLYNFIRKSKNFQVIWKNPYLWPLALAIGISLCIFALPWQNYIHFGKLPSKKPDTVFVKIPSPIKQDTPIKPHHPKTYPVKYTPIKPSKQDTSSKSKYDLSHATLSQSAVGDNAQVHNYNGLKPRHLDSTMYFNLMKRVYKFWDEHPKAERNLIEVDASPDKDSRQLESELIYELKSHHFKVTQSGFLLTPIQSDNKENFELGFSTDNKNLMVTVMEQPNIQ